jgi:cobalt-zinc-cadmium efflux system outer membrane protein
MFTHSLRAAIVAAALVPAFVRAAPLTLDRALDLAVARSQSTRAAAAGVASARETAHAAARRPDPVLQAGIDNLPVAGGRAFDPASDSMTQKHIGVSQEWLSADKRAARQAAADAMTEREVVAADIATADVRLQTALAYIDAHYASEVLALKALMAHHAHEELEAARSRLASATASSSDVLALVAARGAAEDESAEARQARDVASATLRRWIGTSPEETSEPSIAEIPGEATFVDHQPQVRSAQAALEVARRDESMAATERNPNWTWQVSYGQRSGYSDMVSVGVSIPFPVRPAERQDREVASRRALVDQADAALVEARRAASGEYHAASAEARHLTDRIDRYRAEVVTPTQQRTTAALAGYGGGSVSLASLFEARHAEVEARCKLLDLERRLAIARARLAFEPLPQGVAQ